MKPLGIDRNGRINMNESETITKQEDCFTEYKPEVANMDMDDFLDLLMESRIIQAS